MIDAVLLAVLACPVCHCDVREHDGKIVCLGCSRVYPVRDGIPIMLEEEAEVFF